MQIDRYTLEDGLAKLGYVLPESDLEHLLAQLSAVPGLTTATAVTSASLAASQLDAAASPAEWREMARAAFDALDLDGDGKVHRDEMAALLAGRCPKDVRPCRHPFGLASSYACRSSMRNTMTMHVAPHERCPCNVYSVPPRWMLGSSEV